MKITLCKRKSIWSSLFFFKMLDMQNQTLITIACVRISAIAPINLIKVNRFKHCCASSCVRPDPWTKSGNWKCCNLNLCAFVVDSFQTTMRNLESMLSKIIKKILNNNFFIAFAFKHCIFCVCVHVSLYKSIGFFFFH